jgi:hypothetical protein
MMPTVVSQAYSDAAWLAAAGGCGELVLAGLAVKCWRLKDMQNIIDRSHESRVIDPGLHWQYHMRRV